MGLYDCYIPDPPIDCPLCGTKLVEWQGKDSLCFLLRWKQNIKGPIRSESREGALPPRPEEDEYLLPDQFEIYSYDCPIHQPITAWGKAPEGIWLTTEVLGHGHIDKSMGRPRWKPYSPEKPL